jgi:hypothetical protein
MTGSGTAHAAATHEMIALKAAVAQEHRRRAATNADQHPPKSPASLDRAATAMLWTGLAGSIVAMLAVQ